jgi:hypothetical protein
MVREVAGCVDPKSIECEHGDAPSCLTAEQVETARALYAAVPDRCDPCNERRRDEVSSAVPVRHGGTMGRP